MEVKRPDVLLFTVLAVLALGGAFAMDAVQTYLSGDWAEIRECRETYWTCEAEWTAKARIPQTAPVVFDGVAKACGEYQAFRKSSERARFDCAMSRRALGTTCAEVETDCFLPQDHH